jgi:CDP-diacylglycerol--glycerol-3-phosphate 3-phosphatidyltransferase
MDAKRSTLLPDWLKNLVLGGLDPIADALIRGGVSPNLLTMLSLLVTGFASACYAVGEMRWGAVVLLASGTLDMLDGKVARRGGMSSEFGAFFDSTMDRLGEGLLYGGIAIYLVTTSGQRFPIAGLLLCFGVMTTSFLVSYTRARAEGLGLDARVGLAPRAERIVLLAAVTLFFEAGPHGWFLLGLLAFLFVISAVTVVQRIAVVRAQTSNGVPHPAGSASGAPAAAVKGN